MTSSPGLDSNHPIVDADPVEYLVRPIVAVAIRSQVWFDHRLSLDQVLCLSPTPIPPPKLSKLLHPTLLTIPELKHWTRATLIVEHGWESQVNALADTIEAESKTGDHFFWQDKVLCQMCRQRTPQTPEIGTQVAVSSVFRTKSLVTAHDELYSGH